MSQRSWGGPGCPESCRSPSQIPTKGNLASCSSPSSFFFLPHPHALPLLLGRLLQTLHISPLIRNVAAPSCSSGSFPQALQISWKPELLVAALTVVFQELFPGIWPRVEGLQSVSVQTTAVRTKWHTDQKAYDKTSPVAVTQTWSLSSNSLGASFGAEIAAGGHEIIGIQSVVKLHNPGRTAFWQISSRGIRFCR